MDLRVVLEDLTRRIEILEQENAELRAENDRLRERLRLNSTTSSLPPSRDLYKANRKNRHKSDRKAGAQPGHEPQGYQLQEADEIIHVFPELCVCGHPMEITDGFSVDQKIEILPIHPHVTEYRRWHGVCRHCGKKKKAALPEGVQPDLLGDKAKAIISALSGFFHHSKRDVQQILKDIFHLPMSLGLVSTTERRVRQALASPYQDLGSTKWKTVPICISMKQDTSAVAKAVGDGCLPIER